MLMRSRKLAPIALALAGLAFTGASLAEDAAQKEKDAKEKDRALVTGFVETRELLRLMDKDQSGKVSKKEFMSFMEAEFDRLDADKSGELDINELSNLKMGKRTGGR